MAEALHEHGTGSRDTVCNLLNAYLREVSYRGRLAPRRAGHAARRVKARVITGHCFNARRAARDYEALQMALDVRDELRAKAAEYAAAAAEAAQPQPDATPAENAQALAGYERLAAAGGYAVD